MCYIYYLSDPITNQVRYVGKANNIKKRLYCHLSKNNLIKPTHKNNWINSLLRENIKPLIEVIDEVPLSEWEFWEKYWISQFKTWDFDLTNKTDGGGKVYNVVKFGSKNPNYKQTITDDNILSLLNEGLSQKEIANKLNTNVTLIFNRCKKYNINFRKRRGVKISNGCTHNFRTDITPEIIKKLIKDGNNMKQICEKLNADISTIKRRIK